MVNLSYLKEPKQWRKFFTAMEFGDSASFVAESYREVETARAAATQFNNRCKRGFRIRVSNKPASDDPLTVSITTELYE